MSTAYFHNRATDHLVPRGRPCNAIMAVSLSLPDRRRDSIVSKALKQLQLPEQGGHSEAKRGSVKFIFVLTLCFNSLANCHTNNLKVVILKFLRLVFVHWYFIILHFLYNKYYYCLHYT